MQEAPNSEFVSLSPADRTAIVRIRLYIVFGIDICIIFLFNEQTLFQCHIFAENYHFEGPRRMTSTSYIIFFCSLRVFQELLQTRLLLLLNHWKERSAFLTQKHYSFKGFLHRFTWLFGSQQILLVGWSWVYLEKFLHKLV